PVVLAAVAGGEADVHLLPEVLPDVGDDEVTRGPVEGEAPGIAQAVGPDLAAGAGGGAEGVVGRHRVGAAPVHVDAEHLAEERAEVLAVAEGVAPAAAVAEADVEHAVAAEREAAPVVVGEGLLDEEHEALAARIRGVGAGVAVE